MFPVRVFEFAEAEIASLAGIEIEALAAVLIFHFPVTDITGPKSNEAHYSPFLLLNIHKGSDFIKDIRGISFIAGLIKPIPLRAA